MGATQAAPFHRTILVSILAVLVVLLGVVILLIGLAIAFLGGVGGLAVGIPVLAGFLAGLGIVIAAVGALAIVIGLGLWHQRGWAWWLAAVVDVLVLAGAAQGGALRAAVGAGAVLLYLILVKRYFR